MSYRTATSESSEETSGSPSSTYCIFLHIAEGVGLQRARGSTANCQHDQILLHASLNTVKFEIEGHSTETATIFNSNCIWECSLNDVKKMKTENRPLRIACFLNNGTNKSPPLKQIGTLLLPIRGVPTVTTLRNYQPKILWHKLGALCTEWRSYKPEIYLLIIVAKKSLIEDNALTAILGKKSLLVRSPRSSETAGMLHSQNNVYVQLLENLGLIQVGNNPDEDCDVFLVTLTLKRIKDLSKLLQLESTSTSSSESTRKSKFLFQYELFGSATPEEITIDACDNYALNQKIALKFKSSISSLRLYFQRIFYIPIVIYYNRRAIATYRFDCSKFFPDKEFFETNKIWNKNGVFIFDRLHKLLSPRSMKPSVEFTFTLQLLEKYSILSNEIVSLKNTFIPYNNIDKGASGDGKAQDHNHHNNHQTVCSSRSGATASCEKSYCRTKSEPSLFTPYVRFDQEVSNDVHKTKDACIDTEDLLVLPPTLQTLLLPPTTTTTTTTTMLSHCGEDNDRAIEKVDACVDTEQLIACSAIGINTDSNVASSTMNDTEMLTIKIIKELEAWKSQQMQEFCWKLEQKEISCLRDLEKNWLLEHGTLQQDFESKQKECVELKKQLDQLKIELDARNIEEMRAAKAEIERTYEQKIQKLESQIQYWKMELKKQQQTFSAAERLCTDEYEHEKMKLQHENHALKSNILHLEQKLITLGKTHFSADQLKDMMADMVRAVINDANYRRKISTDKYAKLLAHFTENDFVSNRQQTERFASVEKQRNFFKEKLARANRELQQLKLRFLKQQEINLIRNSKETTESLDISVSGISQDEKVNMNSAFTSKRIVEPRIESDLIKEMILKHAESTTTSYDDMESLKSQF